MKQSNWTKFIEELGESVNEELNEELLSQVVKWPDEKMSFPELQHYLSNEFWVHFDEETTRSKLHDKDKYLQYGVLPIWQKKETQNSMTWYLQSLCLYLRLKRVFLKKVLKIKMAESLKAKIKSTSLVRRRRQNIKSKYPQESWSFIVEQFNNKAGCIRYSKQIRERFNNVIDPNINKNPFSDEEIKFILRKAYELKKKWASIAKLMPGRTDNKIKNCYNSKMNKIKKKMPINKADRKKEQKILQYIQKYDTFDPDELVNQIELDEKNQSSIKIECANENSNTSNNQNYIPPIIPSYPPILFMQGPVMQSQYQTQYIGIPMLVLKKIDETSQI
ncbi:unnamed protein product (macronuclear) [Paramecium tetraurelia]|uniref:Uncharacterized protein n=1 Tax=Paramecium tetraurelia TaxID=5888 RepID=A0DBD3_PARTE|nr:uncharacterized protein GSPATT00015244001 [Paramecium tetraurelia]CAK80350.1 unnamed protein product [Paramecium tetraurelia]|eukprot:XP_001447747.1 hypothetical protein (macronuclear) [Paramecium tetraurelia strain d4-2]